MEMLIKNNYVLNNVNKRELKKIGFRHHSKYFNDEENVYYSMRFPVLKYLKSTTIEGEIIINSCDGTVKLNAYNSGTDGFYPPFYHEECTKVYKPIMEKINVNFYEMFNKIGIKKIDN